MKKPEKNLASKTEVHNVLDLEKKIYKKKLQNFDSSTSNFLLIAVKLKSGSLKVCQNRVLKLLHQVIVLLRSYIIIIVLKYE